MKAPLIRMIREAAEGKLGRRQLRQLAGQLRNEPPDDAGALRALAWLLDPNPFLQRAPRELERVLERLVLIGDAEAHFHLALRLEDRKPALAAKMLDEAIRGGVSGAMVRRARQLLGDPETTTRSERTRAEQLLQRAAARRDPEAALWLGLKRDFWDGGLRWKEAARWYSRAARAGIVDAMVNYGVCLERGLGVARDPKAAARWYEKAAALGDEDAQRHLARVGTAVRRAKLHLVEEPRTRRPRD